MLALEGRVASEERDKFVDDFRRLCVQDERTARKLSSTRRELDEVRASNPCPLPTVSSSPSRVPSNDINEDSIMYCLLLYIARFLLTSFSILIAFLLFYFCRVYFTQFMAFA